MAMERRPEEQRSIVIRSEQASMEQVAQNPFLERVGFSPELPQRLMRLNDVLARRDAPYVNSVGILMVPGKIPLITTNVKHSQGMKVYVEGGGGTASLEMNSSRGSATVTIEDIQGFVKQLFPNKEVKVFSYAHENLEEPLEDLDRDLYDISSEFLKPLNELKITKGPRSSAVLPYYIFEVKVSGQDLPTHASSLFKFNLRTVSYNNKVGCEILEFNYKGRVKQVEEVIDRVTELLDKPLFYPFTEEIGETNSINENTPRV